MTTIKTYNYTPSPPLPATLTPKDKFRITCPWNTDIWRKPPAHNVFTAPVIYTSLPLHSFRRAQVTAKATWKTLYDQGGLLLVLPAKRTSNTHSSPQNQNPETKRWVKAGVEFYEGKPFMSVVAADEWADWSLTPLPQGAEGMTVEFEREREKDGKGLSTVLRVTLIGEKGERTIIREVTWAFFGQGSEEEEVWVGPFAAKPTKSEDGSDLVVEFSGFEVEREG